jgi:small-conductance mechanosensitive channel
MQAVFRRFDNSVIRYQWQKISGYIAVVIIIVLVGPTWMSGFQNTATYFGLLTAGLAIALQAPITDLVGWIFILWRQPFKVGDRIQIGDHAGDVIDLRLFQFSLMEIGNWVDAEQSTGRVIHIPNGNVFKDALANYSAAFQFIWNEIPVLVTFESNWKKAKHILETVASKHGTPSESVQRQVRESSRKFLIMYSTLTPIVYTSVKDSGVLLTIRYLCEPRQRRGSSQTIWEDILEEFARCPDIDFAYPTQRFYDNSLEGKPGTKPVTEHAPAKLNDRKKGTSNGPKN